MPRSEQGQSGRRASGALAALFIVATDPTDSAPAETVPAETVAPEPSGSAEETDDDATAITWVAVIAAVALLGIAVWWMVRSSGGEHPVRRMGDESEVI